MADSERLKAWLLTHSKLLNLRLTQFDWVSDWKLKDLYDLQISIEIRGQKFIGRGTAATEDEAILKAGGEALERAYTSGNRVHSTGVAVHTDPKTAQTSARLELNERASFFWHFFSETPFLRLSSSHWSHLRERYLGAFEKLKVLKTDLSFFSTNSKNGVPTLICIATDASEPKTWGGIIGLSAKMEISKAIEGAFFECLRATAAFHILNNSESLTEQEFLRIQNPTSPDRQKLARNIDYWRRVNFLFPKTETEVVPLGQQTHFLSHIQRLPCPFDEIESAPICAYRAGPHEDHTELNSVFDKPDQLTLAWLSDFYGIAINPSRASRRSHFLG